MITPRIKIEISKTTNKRIRLNIQIEIMLLALS